MQTELIDTGSLQRSLEALLFVASESLSIDRLVKLTGATHVDVAEALGKIADDYSERGVVLREVAGGYRFASSPAAREVVEAYLLPPKTSLSPAAMETLAIVAYLQPVSRPEITRIRGVSADSATATLLERGLIEEAGHSPFGAVLYRTSQEFLKLFGLASLDELPDIAQWDPTPEESAELRERLMRAGEARSGGAPEG
jgi:segregation and condensation protein B